MVASVPQTTQGAVEIAEQVEAAVEAATASGTDAPASPLRST
jgi:hypothetical protein